MKLNLSFVIILKETVFLGKGKLSVIFCTKLKNSMRKKYMFDYSACCILYGRGIGTESNQDERRSGCESLF